MPVAKLRTMVYLDYRDSGKPQSISTTTEGGESYETLVLVHGVMFNQEIFSPLFTTISLGIRLITYNHRGYPGSSSLLPDELADGCSARTTYATDLVEFLEYISLNLGVPNKPIVVSWEKGGNILVGLASPTFLPREVRAKGIANASCLILHDCPGNVLGRIPTCDIVKTMIGCPDMQFTLHSCQQSGHRIPGNEFPDNSHLHRDYSSSTTSSFSTGASGSNEFHPPSLKERYLSWICGFYQHHNHLPHNLSHVQPAYSSWAYKCSLELLPCTLIDSSVVLDKNIPPPPPTNSTLRATAASNPFPPHPHLWKLSDGRNQQVEFARVALVQQKDIPVGLVWNGESPESTIDAARAASGMGAKVFLLSETGNSLMFAHEPREWLIRIISVARDLV